MVGGSVLAFQGSGNYTAVGVRGITMASVIVKGKNVHVNVQLTERVASATSVNLSTSGPLTAPASVTVAAGSTNYGFNVLAGNVASDTPASLTATAGGDSATANTTIVAQKVRAVNFGTNPVTAGGSSKGTLNLSTRAGSPTVVTLSSSNPRVHVPAAATVNTGQSRSQYFMVTTDGVDSDETSTIGGTIGITTTTSTFYVRRASVKAFQPARNVLGGRSFRVGVKLTGKAGPSGRTVAVVSSNTSVIPNGNVVIAPGASSGVARFTTSTVGSQTAVNLTAAGIQGTVNVLH